MKADDIRVRDIYQLEEDPVIRQYFDRNDVYVAGTIFLRNEQQTPLLIKQTYAPKNVPGNYKYKIPGGVASLDVEDDEYYHDVLWDVLQKARYSKFEAHAIILKEKELYSNAKRPISEKAFKLKFIEETGLIPMAFKYRYHQTRPSTRGEPKDFLQIFFKVDAVYDASLSGFFAESLITDSEVLQREFTKPFKIEETRVIDFSYEEAVQCIFDNHRRALEVLHSFYKKEP